MAKLKSELEVTCPCCGSTLVVDVNLGRIVSHREPERGDKPELNDAARILAAEAARRESLFEQSMEAEKSRDDALTRRFEEALKQARTEPITGRRGISIWIDDTARRSSAPREFARQRRPPLPARVVFHGL